MRWPLLLLLTACGPSSTPPVEPVVDNQPPTAKPEPTREGIPPGATGACPAIADCEDADVFRGDGLGTSDDLPPVEKTEMPPWELDQAMESACAYACAPEGATADLLAWSIIEDGRPLRNHNAFYLIEHPGGAKWTAVIMYRHATNDWWNISVSHHSPARPIQEYDHRPSPRELGVLLDENGWDWEHGDFEIIAGNMIDELWPAAAGGPPPRHLPADVEAAP